MEAVNTSSLIKQPAAFIVSNPKKNWLTINSNYH